MYTVSWKFIRYPSGLCMNIQLWLDSALKIGLQKMLAFSETLCVCMYSTVSVHQSARNREYRASPWGALPYLQSWESTDNLESVPCLFSLHMKSPYHFTPLDSPTPRQSFTRLAVFTNQSDVFSQGSGSIWKSTCVVMQSENSMLMFTCTYLNLFRSYSSAITKLILNTLLIWISIMSNVNCLDK